MFVMTGVLFLVFLCLSVVLFIYGCASYYYELRKVRMMLEHNKCNKQRLVVSDIKRKLHNAKIVKKYAFKNAKTMLALSLVALLFYVLTKIGMSAQ
jgi:hypothetical protein